MTGRALRVVAGLVLAAAGLFAIYEVAEQPWAQVTGSTLVHGRGHAVALTFDDGPNPFVTPGVLDTLERAHVHATFFVVGRAARAHPELLKRMVADGDEVENHTEDHAHLNALFSRLAIGREIDGASRAILAATGRQPQFLRPPFGARNRMVTDVANEHGYTLVTWTAMLGDEPANDIAPAVIVKKLLPSIGDGAIIVLHDGDQGRDTHAGRTYEAQATALLVRTLQAQGYRFLTVAEMAQTVGV
jgi:peptidoglycan/xylan/chitin deacetylase (PgdA/CDA1 family)